MQTLESRYILSGEELTKAPESADSGSAHLCGSPAQQHFAVDSSAEHFKEEQPKMSARKLAVQLLNRTEQEQSYSNLLLDSALSQSQLDDRDKRLCASLYYGVIERRITPGCGDFPLQQAAAAKAGLYRAEHSSSGHLSAAVLRPDPVPCGSQ